MNKKLDKAHTAFTMHFGYCPKFPQDIEFDQEAYADELLKCVADNFDYTIEKYGTIPKQMKGTPDIIID